MDVILPEEYKLSKNAIRPERLSNGVLQPRLRLQHLLNYELLLVLNGKRIGYTINFNIPTNRTISFYDYYNNRFIYTETDKNQIEEIFRLADLNGMQMIPTDGVDGRYTARPFWATYFLPPAKEDAIFLSYYLQKYNPNTVVSNYIIGLLQGYSLLDIEANIFCYKNGQNIIQLRKDNKSNFQKDH